MLRRTDFSLLLPRPPQKTRIMTPTLRLFPVCRFPVIAIIFLSIMFRGDATADSPPLQPIFDGRTLDGWDGNPQIWRVEDGAITGEIRAGASLAKNEFIYWHSE